DRELRLGRGRQRAVRRGGQAPLPDQDEDRRSGPPGAMRGRQRIDPRRRIRDASVNAIARAPLTSPLSPAGEGDGLPSGAAASPVAGRTPSPPPLGDRGEG